MTPVRKATPAEKANAARLRDLKHTVELLLTRPSRDSDSISGGRNSRGEPVFEVKFYRQEGETREQLQARWQEAVETMAARYPLSSGHVWAKNGGE